MSNSSGRHPRLQLLTNQIVRWAICLFPIMAQAQGPWQTPFERDSNYSATYDEVIEYYQKLSDAYAHAELTIVGPSDHGKPIYSLVISNTGSFDPPAIRAEGRAILMVNNGIHAGEPCGIDASMMLARDLLQNEAEVLNEVALVIVPAYNVGGMHNRGAYSRANQVGPAQHGFRGNARHLDLNRDFIKADSKNAETFSRLFTLWDPDVFIDNHTTNGADYQYVMTLIASQKDKMYLGMRDVQEQMLLPKLYEAMNQSPYTMVPYVNVRNTPDEGIAGFLDLPRYSSGYATLHHSFAYISEAHMLKPFHLRVRGTYQLMREFLLVIQSNKEAIFNAREAAKNAYQYIDTVAIQWSLDFGAVDSILFRGYDAKDRPSAITGESRMYYDRNAPYEKHVPFFNTYQVDVSVLKPEGYIIPQAYEQVIRRLQWNGVRVERLPTDTTIEVEAYRIQDYQTSNRPYEGHYLHSQVKVSSELMERTFYAGDAWVSCDQPELRFLVEVLEPQAPDSYFAWNFFDGILMQKEYFSSYLFEDTAVKLLEEDAALRQALEDAKAEDEALRTDARRQLDFIYRRSLYYEGNHNLYPVFRVMR